MGKFKDKFIDIRFNAVKYRRLQKEGTDEKFAKVLKEIQYTDSKGIVWTVPVGFKSDGISSRQSTQWISGEPFEGDTIRAALIHDVYCENQKRSQEATHKVFREILKKDGVSWPIRSVMYRAVVIYNRIRNPRWA